MLSVLQVLLNRLKNEGWQVEGFFYNPNIHPEEEYRKRLENAKFLLTKIGVTLIEGKYDNENWFKKLKVVKKKKKAGNDARYVSRYDLERH